MNPSNPLNASQAAIAGTILFILRQSNCAETY